MSLKNKKVFGVPFYALIGIQLFAGLIFVTTGNGIAFLVGASIGLAMVPDMFAVIRKRMAAIRR